MEKKSEDYLSENAKRLLEDPKRAKMFIQAYLEAGGSEMVGRANGKDFTLKNPEDVNQLDDTTAIWIAKGQAGFEEWLKENGLTEDPEEESPTVH